MRGRVGSTPVQRVLSSTDECSKHKCLAWGLSVEAVLRRAKERRPEIQDTFMRGRVGNRPVQRVLDMSAQEAQGRYLEGTGGACVAFVSWKLAVVQSTARLWLKDVPACLQVCACVPA